MIPSIEGRVQYLYDRSLQDWTQSGLVYVRPESDLSGLDDLSGLGTSF